MTDFSSPEEITPRDYQQEAVEAWMQNRGQGILHMATGTGKTLTSLFAAERLQDLQDGRLGLVVVAPYQHLVDQWVEELRAFGVTPHRAYQSRRTWEDEVAGAITEFRHGARDVFVVVTTQHTFAADHFQDQLDRLPGHETLLIADEVHHLGAPHLRTALPTAIRARLGLSATPERWHDEEGTRALETYFSGEIVFEYDLQEAIDNGHLCQYYYVPHIVGLTPEEAEEYQSISKSIGRRLGSQDGDGLEAIDNDEQLQQLLFKRARLIGTAERKLDTLAELVEQSRPLKHALVYCGDGSVEQPESGIAGDRDVVRQLSAVTEMLGSQMNLSVHQFTYEEDQETRERLLDDFETGVLDALVAIRCLDEGVDVPATETAFMLASSTNPRQFVQRRGRILRTHRSKEYATIHDFIVRPPPAIQTDEDDPAFGVERNLVRRELERVSTFVGGAKNHPDATLSDIPTTSGSITNLKKDFNLLDV
jgi:DNA phosphorothioation system restriction enzyme